MRLYVRIMNAPKGEAERMLDPPGGLLGRSSESALQLAYDSVSRQHAELRYDGKDWWLYHLSRTSSTLLDDQLLSGGHPRKLGLSGVLQVGRVVLEYRQEEQPSKPVPQAAEPLSGDVTLVLPRRAAIAVPQSLLAQMSPVRAEEPEPEGPLTLVRRPKGSPPPPPRAAEASAPPTLIRPAWSPPPLPPPLPVEAPATMIRQPPRPAVSPGTSSAVVPQRLPGPVPAEVVEHQPQPVAIASEVSLLAQVQAERDQLRRELEQLTAEAAKLKREQAVLQDARAALGAQLAALQAEKPAAPSADTPRENSRLLCEKALELLQPFSRSLEQASESLRKGNSEQARTLLRSASFALADLRDLFQS